MLNETLELIDKFDNTITVDTIELIKKVGELEERTIIKFKKAKPEVMVIEDIDQLCNKHFDGTKTSRFNCKEPNESNGPKANTEEEKIPCALVWCPNLIDPETAHDSEYCSVSCWQFGTTDKDTCICPESNKMSGVRLAHCQWSGHFNQSDTVTKKICNNHDCTEPVDGQTDYCFNHKPICEYPDCNRIPTPPNKLCILCIDKPNITDTVTEKGKELNKTLEPSDATNSSIDNIDKKKICKGTGCNEPKSEHSIRYCEQHRRRKSKRIPMKSDIDDEL